MRKNKKLLGIALVPCMVGSLLAGCTASSESTDATSSSTAAEDTTEAPVESSDDETDAVAPETTEETQAPEIEDDENGQSAAFIDVLRGISDIESYRMSTSITVNQKTVTDGEDTGETEITVGLEGLTDGKGNISVTISADYDEEDGSFSVHGDLLTISKVDDRMYLDLTSLYDVVMDSLGAESAYIEQYAAAFGVSMDEIESLLVLGIPVGDLDLSKDSYADLQGAMELIYDDMAVAIDSLGEDFVAQDGNTYTITVNNDNLIAVVDAFLSAFEDNIGDIYDAYVDGMKATDYAAYCETIMSAVMDEIIEGIETATETEIDEDMRAEVETEIKAAVEEYQLSMEEAIAELEDSKDEFLQEFNSAVEEFNDGKEEAQEAIDAGEDSAEAVLTLSVDGEEGSRKITSELNATVQTTEVVAAEEPEVSSVIAVTVKTAIEEGDVEISAPKDYAPLSDVIEIAYKVYLAYEEMAGTGGYDDGDDDDNYDDFDFNYGDTSYTQDELAENYGVTLKENQALVYATLDNDAVLVTAYDGMEFYQADDAHGYLMEFSDDVNAYITVWVNDITFDLEFYKNYYGEDELKKLEDNLYYHEESTGYGEVITVISFAENITIEIEFETYTEELMDEMTGGDGEGFLKELLELCEIVPAP